MKNSNLFYNFESENLLILNSMTNLCKLINIFVINIIKFLEF